jgi:hypothetical protein
MPTIEAANPTRKPNTGKSISHMIHHAKLLRRLCFANTSRLLLNLQGRRPPLKATKERIMTNSATYVNAPTAGTICRHLVHSSFQPEGRNVQKHTLTQYRRSKRTSNTYEADESAPEQESIQSKDQLGLCLCKTRLSKAF